MNEQQLSFLKEHLPKTKSWVRYGNFMEKRWHMLDQHDFNQLENLINQELGLYFKSTSNPSKQMPCKSSES